MTPGEMKVAVSDLMQADVPVWCWGPPGVGKSAVVSQVASEKGIGFIDVRLTTMDPVDLRGLPVVKKGSTEWARPSFLPAEGEGILLLDEIAQARTDMQAAAMQLVLDRCVGDHKLGPLWRVVAASNRVEDRAGAGRVITPLLNRFVHLEVEPSLGDWLEWALREGIDHRVTAYLKYRPDRLLHFKPESGEKAFCTPRSWAMASKALKACTRRSLLGCMIRGAVGEGSGTEFMGFLKLYEDLPDLDEVWRNPSGAPIPEELASQWAMGGVLCEGVRKEKGTPERLKAFGTYATRMSAEIAMATIKEGLAVNQGLKNTPTITAFLMANLDLMRSRS